jgi:hypothetical protein
MLMSRRSLSSLGLVWVLALDLAVLWVQPAAAGDDWQYDVVRPRLGAPLRGLVLDQDGDHVLIKCVKRDPGRHTILYKVKLERSKVLSVDLLPKEARDRLRQRLRTIEQNRVSLDNPLLALDPASKGPGPLVEQVPLTRVPWVGPGKHKDDALAYESAYFLLKSNAPKNLVRLAALHLEEIYTAYARFLPPRVKGAKTTILLARTLDDYHALVKGQGRNLFNPAFYDPGRNQILCGSSIQRLTDELLKAREYHKKLWADLNARAKEMGRVYGGKQHIPLKLRQPIELARNEIQRVQKRNTAVLGKAAERLFRRLYHEAFHAYLANFVYPPREGEVPRWLNEGLAQVFEMAILDAGELRIDVPDRAHSLAVRKAAGDGTLMPLKKLLRSGAKEFLVAHAGDRRMSDRCYQASWALAFYLAFEHKLLGTPALDHYVHALKRGTDPLLAFRDLVGRPLDAFEKDYLRALGRMPVPNP